MFRSLLLILAIAVGSGGVATAEPLQPTDIIKALQGGGYTIYFRHAQTDWSLSDNVYEAGDWKSCDPARMRQLSDAGRKTSEEIGNAIRVLKIPIGEVLSSEYCRAVETAQKLNLGPVTATTDIMNLRASRFVGGDAAAIKRLQNIISKPPTAGTNRVITAHGNLARMGTGAYPPEGGAVIIKDDADAENGFRVLGILRPGAWLEHTSR